MNSIPQQRTVAQYPLGEIFVVDGLRMHLHRSGPPAGAPRPAARPTIVIEAGAGAASALYSRLQIALQTEFDVISYDRAGLGWSAPSDGPADAATIAARLHRLLEVAGVRGPLLMVGHSLGAFILRVYARRYPEQVAGLVLIDGSHPRQPVHPALPEMAPLLEAHRAAHLKELAQYRASGEPSEGMLQSMQIFADLPGVAEQLLATLSEHALDAAIKEYQSFTVSAEQAEAAGSLGDLPLLVLWAPVVMAWPGLSQEQTHGQWQALQADMAALSTRGSLVAVEGAEHVTLVMEPALAAITAAEIAAMARGIAEMHG
nr:alpha/beta hydrolase [uncultured Roseateles sp.]